MTEKTQAEQLRDEPTPEIDEAIAQLREDADAGGSEAHREFHQDDGSVLIVRIRAGDDLASLEAIAPPG